MSATATNPNIVPVRLNVGSTLSTEGGRGHQRGRTLMNADGRAEDRLNIQWHLKGSG